MIVKIRFMTKKNKKTQSKGVLKFSSNDEAYHPILKLRMISLVNCMQGKKKINNGSLKNERLLTNQIKKQKLEKIFLLKNTENEKCHV